MEPQIAPGDSDMYRGVSEDRRLHFGLYGSMAPCEYGPSATEAAAALGAPGFVSSFYPLEVAGTMGEEEPLVQATAASRNHRDAERRRRERIKCHLDRLRDILACDAKIDKASLLAKAVEHVRNLKQRATEIGEIESFPTETDEVSVHPGDLPAAAGRGPVITASLCCEDRSGLLPELADTLRALRLRILRAEIATLGGRVRNVLVVAGDGSGEDEEVEDGSGGQAAFLKDALSALVHRAVPGGAARPKRRRVSERSAATA